MGGGADVELLDKDVEQIQRRFVRDPHWHYRISDDTREIVCNLWDDGARIEAIADRLGRRPQAVQKYVQRLIQRGVLQKRAWTFADAAYMEQELDDAEIRPSPDGAPDQRPRGPADNAGARVAQGDTTAVHSGTEAAGGLPRARDLGEVQRAAWVLRLRDAVQSGLIDGGPEARASVMWKQINELRNEMPSETKSSEVQTGVVWPTAGSVADKALKAYNAGDEISVIANALGIKTANVVQFATYWRSKGAAVVLRRKSRNDVAIESSPAPAKPVETPKPEAPKAAPQLSKKVYDVPGGLLITVPGAAQVVDFIRRKIVNECAKPTGAPHENAIRLQALAETVLELESA